MAKGLPRVHPEMSPNDRFPEFEIRRKLLAGAATPANKADYARSAYVTRLEIEEKDECRSLQVRHDWRLGFAHSGFPR